MLLWCGSNGPRPLFLARCSASSICLRRGCSLNKVSNISFFHAVPLADGAIKFIKLKELFSPFLISLIISLLSVSVACGNSSLNMRLNFNSDFPKYLGTTLSSPRFSKSSITDASMALPPTDKASVALKAPSQLLVVIFLYSNSWKLASFMRSLLGCSLSKASHCLLTIRPMSSSVSPLPRLLCLFSVNSSKALLKKGSVTFFIFSSLVCSPSSSAALITPALKLRTAGAAC